MPEGVLSKLLEELILAASPDIPSDLLSLCLLYNPTISATRR
jgi:hypothetical protein